MSYLWRGIPVEVYTGGKFRRGAKKGPTLYAIFENDDRTHIAELTEQDLNWPIEVLASVYMPEYLKNRIKAHERAVAAWGGNATSLSPWLKSLPYPLELMVIEDEDTFEAARNAYDLSRA